MSLNFSKYAIFASKTVKTLEVRNFGIKKLLKFCVLIPNITKTVENLRSNTEYYPKLLQNHNFNLSSHKIYLYPTQKLAHPKQHNNKKPITQRERNKKRAHKLIMPRTYNSPNHKHSNAKPVANRGANTEPTRQGRRKRKWPSGGKMDAGRLLALPRINCERTPLCVRSECWVLAKKGECKRG
jgi:hypothetical protein